MSPDPRLDLAEVDVAPRTAERIRRRAQRELRRWADPFARTWIGRLERVWILRLEPVAAFAGSAAMVAWAFAMVFAG